MSRRIFQHARTQRIDFLKRAVVLTIYEQCLVVRLAGADFVRREEGQQNEQAVDRAEE